MGIGRITIILKHTWLVEHNPEIDWSTGKVSMTKCHCRWYQLTEVWLGQLFGRQLAGSQKAKSCQKVHIKEVPEG